MSQPDIYPRVEFTIDNGKKYGYVVMVISKVEFIMNMAEAKILLNSLQKAVIFLDKELNV